MAEEAAAAASQSFDADGRAIVTVNNTDLQVEYVGINLSRLDEELEVEYQVEIEGTEGPVQFEQKAIQRTRLQLWEDQHELLNDARFKDLLEHWEPICTDPIGGAICSVRRPGIVFHCRIPYPSLEAMDAHRNGPDMGALSSDLAELDT